MQSSDHTEASVVMGSNAGAGGAVFSLRIVTLDYYMAPPHPELDACYSSLLGQPIAEVPVVRIFGTTLAGQKTCLHLHKVFPYFYVPYDDDLPQDINHAWMYVRSMASAIEKALKLASTVGSKRQHVYSCSLVRGRNFYGFFPDEQLFVKIMLYYPQEVSRTSALLLGGGILNRRFQPHESHIPFLLQILVDHNLTGMGHVHLSDVKFRHPVLKNQFLEICASKSSLKNLMSSVTQHIASSGTSTGEVQSSIGNIMGLWCTTVENHEMQTTAGKQSTCELEGDTYAAAILNQSQLSYIPLENASPDVKMVQSLIPMWDELNATKSMDVLGKERKMLLKQDDYADRYKTKLEDLIKSIHRGHADVLKDSGVDECNISYGEGDSKISQELKHKTNTLLSCTQAAHSKEFLIENHERHEPGPLNVESGVNFEEGGLINEELIKHQLSQRSQDTDEEAVELLKWMISSQQDDISAGYTSDCEKMDEETPWGQVFQCADEALAKALSDYEVDSQQECQEIMDCGERGKHGSLGGRNMPECPIPQVDGSFDEDSFAKNVPEPDLEDISFLQCNEAEDCMPKQASSLGSERIMHASEKPKNQWGPRSTKHPSSHVSSPRESQNVVEDFKDFDEDLPEVSVRHFVEETGAALVLPDHSVRDLMRNKRHRRQYMPLNIPEKSLELDATSSVDNHQARLPTGKQPENRDHPSRYGLLPFQKLNLFAKGSEVETSIEGKIKANSTPILSPKSSGIEAALGAVGAVSHGINQNKLDTDEYTVSIRSNSRSTDSPEPLNFADSIKEKICDLNHPAVDKAESPKGLEDEENLPIYGSPTKKATFQTPGDVFCCIDATDPTLNPCKLVFWKKPPTVEHLLSSFRTYGLPSSNVGKVFYGKSEDLPNEPAIMAGMVFKAQSGGVDDLPPFQLRMDKIGGAPSRTYMSETKWQPTNEDDFAILPSHFRNDGTPLYLLSPAKLPPSAGDVHEWLRAVKRLNSHVKKDNTILIGERGKDSQDSFPSQVCRPSSPKYDEAFVVPYASEEVLETVAPSKVCQPSHHIDKNFPSILNVTELNECSSPKKECIRGAAPEKPRARGEISQISGPTAVENRFTPLSQAGFRDPASTGQGQQISVMSIEAFACSRGDLRPDPRYDSIKCIVMVLQNDSNNNQLPKSATIVLLHDDKNCDTLRQVDGLFGCKIVTARDENSLLHMFVWFVRMYDPDMLVGWDVQGYSLGFLAERASNLGFGLVREISRLPMNKNLSHSLGKVSGEENKPKLLGVDKIAEQSVIEDEWGRTHGSGIHVDGRIVLNLWRVMCNEIKLGIYTLEAVAEAVLKRKVPFISWRTLTLWFISGSGQKRHLCLEYYMNRALLNLKIMDQLDLINRTSELARVFGIDFYSVLSRGSQYRVESMMLRVAHSQNFLLISPSKQQVAAQPAMQCLPLVMEPESRFYADPVIVLDFQSLYPSMIIAYNLCYSTCLGKVLLDNPKILGVTSLNLDAARLKDMKDCLTFTPNGIMFVSAKARPGVLPRLLEEILSTRVLVKQSMKKLLPNQKVLERVLNARQLALKLIANVTYGYTAAGFSGRMPCAELADSIVQSGRHTLESAINVVNNNTKWNAKVVYGDTDSMFVLVKGCTRLEAFKVGEEIAEAITELNPHPITLKMEKVYHPCVLLTKKRYVGYSYEDRRQVTPKFDAKGIETVRRDSCGAVSKTLEKSLRILFESRDISQVKAYLLRQWRKIICGRISFQDFIFAKEVRLGTYSSRSSVLPPAAIVATKAMEIDPRAEPRYGERIPYVVVHGEPGARLVDMVVDPHELINTSSTFRLHDVYYITKQIIPALQRIFGLIGVDLSAWYSEVPRVFRPPSTKRMMSLFQPSIFLRKHSNDELEAEGERTRPAMNTRTMDHYYLSQHCVVCGEMISSSSCICDKCLASKELICASLLGRSSRLEKQFKHLLSICRHCGGGNEEDMEDGLGCKSLACSVFYERIKVQKECRAAAITASQCGLMQLRLH